MKIKDSMKNAVRTALVVLAIATNATVRAQVFHDGFESYNSVADITSSNWYLEGGSWGDGASVQLKPRFGQKSFQAGLTWAAFDQQYNNYNYKRCELVRDRFAWTGSTRYWGFSTRSAADFVYDENFTIVHQIHNNPPSPEVGWRSPNIQLSVSANNPRNQMEWNITVRWDPIYNPSGLSPGDGISDSMQSRTVYTGPFYPGSWEDWVFKVKFSYTGSENNSDGFIQVWRNNQQVVNRVMPTGYNIGSQQPYKFKVGIYKPGYVSSSPDAVYFLYDSIRLAQTNNASYVDVQPRP